MLPGVKGILTWLEAIVRCHGYHADIATGHVPSVFHICIRIPEVFVSLLTRDRQNTLVISYGIHMVAYNPKKLDSHH